MKLLGGIEPYQQSSDKHSWARKAIRNSGTCLLAVETLGGGGGDREYTWERNKAPALVAEEYRGGGIFMGQRSNKEFMH